jgi:hypothetical protein
MCVRKSVGQGTTTRRRRLTLLILLGGLYLHTASWAKRVVEQKAVGCTILSKIQGMFGLLCAAFRVVIYS